MQPAPPIGMLLRTLGLMVILGTSACGAAPIEAESEDEGALVNGEPSPKSGTSVASVRNELATNLAAVSDMQELRNGRYLVRAYVVSTRLIFALGEPDPENPGGGFIGFFYEMDLGQTAKLHPIAMDAVVRISGVRASGAGFAVDVLRENFNASPLPIVFDGRPGEIRNAQGAFAYAGIRRMVAHSDASLSARVFGVSEGTSKDLFQTHLVLQPTGQAPRVYPLSGAGVPRVTALQGVRVDSRAQTVTFNGQSEWGKPIAVTAQYAPAGDPIAVSFR